MRPDGKPSPPIPAAGGLGPRLRSPDASVAVTPAAQGAARAGGVGGPGRPTFPTSHTSFRIPTPLASRSLGSGKENGSRTGAGTPRREEGVPRTRSPGRRGHGSRPAPPRRSGFAHAHALPQPPPRAEAAGASGGGRSGKGKKVAAGRASPAGTGLSQTLGVERLLVAGVAERGGPPQPWEAGSSRPGRRLSSRIGRDAGRQKPPDPQPTGARSRCSLLPPPLSVAVRVGLEVKGADLVRKAALSCNFVPKQQQQ